jgi:hypothetical protein
MSNCIHDDDLAVMGVCPILRCPASKDGTFLDVPGEQYCCSIERITYKRYRQGDASWVWVRQSPENLPAPACAEHDSVPPVG